MGHSTRITIVIPTRERAEVLVAALRSVCALDYDGLDILVSDNCSSDNTFDVVHAANDPRVRYVNTGKRISMSHNWEFALSHVPVDNRYVMIIGDDDGILPDGLDRVAELIRETGAKAIGSSYITYIWPNAANNGMGRLLLPRRRGHEMRCSKKWLRRALEGRCFYTELPILYIGGAHHISIIDAIRRKKGAFFQSCIPDIFSCVALSSFVDHYAFSHEPIAIGGHSRHSIGGSWGNSGRHAAPKDVLQASHLFFSEANIPWHGDIPTLADGRIPVSVDLLVYESYLQAAELQGAVPSIKPSDMLPLFLARGIADHKRMADWINLFATYHHLDLSRARRRAAALKPRIMLETLLVRAAALRDTYRLEPNFGVRMRDVYEASIVAGAILKTRPGMMRSYVGTLTKRLGRPLPAAASATP